MVIETEMLADTQPIVEIKACAECFSPVECQVVEVFGRRLQFEILCDECHARYSERMALETASAKRRRAREAFDAMCAPLYRDSDPSRIPVAFVREIEAWEVGPEGVGFVGRAGCGKTRAAWMLLKRLHFAGHGVFGLTATQFSKACAEQWNDDNAVRARAAELLARCVDAEILLLDDMGKQKFTERAETELFALLEHRTSHLVPTIWTANAERGTLKEMLSPDRGEPILRRLVEFSKVVREEGK